MSFHYSLYNNYGESTYKLVLLNCNVVNDDDEIKDDYDPNLNCNHT